MTSTNDKYRQKISATLSVEVPSGEGRTFFKELADKAGATIETQAISNVVDPADKLQRLYQEHAVYKALFEKLMGFKGEVRLLENLQRVRELKIALFDTMKTIESLSGGITYADPAGLQDYINASTILISKGNGKKIKGSATGVISVKKPDRILNRKRN